MKQARDVSKAYPTRAFISKIRRLADGLEKGEQFIIQIAGERIRVPRGARVSVEHERGDDSEEIEFQITWKPSATEEARDGQKRSKRKK